MRLERESEGRGGESERRERDVVLSVPRFVLEIVMAFVYICGRSDERLCVTG